MPASGIDVFIRGAGPVGCALAVALKESGLKVGLLASAATRFAFRPIALSYASRLILERLGAWTRLAATPIEAIHVSQQQGFGRMRMDAADAGVPALGYVVEYAGLLRALSAQAEPLLVEHEVPARCVVHAEGAAPEAQEKRYAQDALVALVRTQPAATVIAFERFTAEGPLALLPCEGRYALVWSCRPQRALSLLECPPQAFLQALAGAAGTRPGNPVEVEGRTVQPLVLRVRPTRVEGRAVYIGNAAQTLHPVAGQGFNLGLRDAWDLAQAFRDAEDPGDARLLARYAQARRLDSQATIRITDALAGAFVGSSRGLRAARGALLTALDVLPGPRRFFARRMMFGPSAMP
ncbi:MAG TPA: FAD-dependent monooxygenase [Burkholderiales bacterium]|nr:FAD-dependent monooxygenase [Burkholderiales bacterium]